MKKVFIILSVILAVLLIAVELYVQSDLFAERIRASVVGPLKEVLGPDAEIGWVGANFIPPFLEVRDIALRDAKGAQAITVRKIKIYINPLPLLLKKVRLPLITVLEPRVFADRSRDGSINIDPIIKRIRQNLARPAADGSQGFSLMLRTITIRNGRIEVKDDVSSTRSSVAGLAMTAKIDLERDHVRATVRSSEVHMSAPAYPEFAGTLKAAFEYDRGRVHLDAVELRSGDAEMSLTGDLGLLPDAVLDLKGTVHSGPQTIGKLADILKPSQKQKGPRVDATVMIKGTIAEPIIDGTIRSSGLSFWGMTLDEAALSVHYRDHGVTLSGEKWRLTQGTRTLLIDNLAGAVGYARGGLDIRRFEITAADLAVRLQGRADPAAGYLMHLSAGSTGAGQALTFFTSFPVEGKVDLDGSVSGPLNAPFFDGAVSAGPVKVRAIPFSDVRGTIGYRDKKITLSSVTIHEQSSRYLFDGSVDFKDKEPVYSAQLQVLQSDVVNIVALFYEQLPLQLSAKGVLSFQGTAQSYTGNGYLALNAGKAYGESFTRGTITAVLSTGKISFPQVVLYKEKGMVKGRGWIGFDGTYSADIESREVNLAAVDLLAGMPIGGDFALAVHSSGSFSAPVVNATLEVDAFHLRDADLGNLRASLDIKDEQLKLSAGLSGESARVTARWLLRKPYTWSIEATVASEGVDPLLLFGAKGGSDKIRVLYNGTITARGNGSDRSSINGEAIFHRLGIVINGYRIDNESEGVLAISNGKITTRSLNFIGQGTRISVTGEATLMSDIDMTLTGTANLSLLKLMYHEIEHAAGTAQVKLTIKDEWDKPDVAGELLIQNGEIKVKDIPQKFMAMNGKITFNQGRIVTDSLKGEMGGGALSVSGWAQFAGLALQEFSTKATVDNVTVRYPEGLTSTLSGNLYYDGDTAEQALSGDIMIKRARYDKRIEWKSMMVDIGKGLYQKKKTDVAWIGDTQINVWFHGMESILLQNNLAKMPLDVDVFLRGTVNHPQLLGRIEARKGTVYFRKNEFKIINASVDFIDPNRMNPILDIQAETQVREYMIRLAVTGTAERAVVTLISDPPLIDTDILSLLALGKRGSELKGRETSVGVGEAASFATGQFQDIFERRARGLTGLDRFQIDPYVGKSDTSVPRVTVGKELVQNKLYITYSSNVGAAASEQIFRIEYILDKHFSLVGERDDAVGNNGADIKYRLEFQ
jgi:autotransporter translocation and assembly factor TamB